MLRISVIIPHLNQHDCLDLCLESLDVQTLDASLFEVVIVDNGSSILPAPRKRGFPITVLQELKPGPGPARNLGVTRASGEILAFIDADCRADPRWLAEALERMQASDDKTVLGGDVRIWRNNPAAFTAIEAYESVFAYRFQLYIEQRGFCGTGNLIVRRKDFLEIGPFKGIDHAEDIEWGKDVRRHGFRFCFAPEIVVYHPARKTLPELLSKWDRHIQHAANAARNSRHWRLKWTARALAVLVSPAIDWIKVARSNRVTGVGSRLKAIAVLTFIRAGRARKMIAVLFGDGKISWNAEPEVKQASG